MRDETNTKRSSFHRVLNQKGDSTIDIKFVAYDSNWRPPCLYATLIVRYNFKTLNVKTYFAFLGNLGSFIFTIISFPLVKFALGNEVVPGASLDHAAPVNNKEKTILGLILITDSTGGYWIIVTASSQPPPPTPNPYPPFTQTPLGFCAFDTCAICVV